MSRVERDQENESLSREKKLEEILAMTFDPMVKIELQRIIEEIRGLKQRIARLETSAACEGGMLGGHKHRVPSAR